MILFFAGIVFVLIDYFTKLYISSNFMVGESVPFILNVFHITYHLNTGAAFSIFEEKRWFLTAMSALIIVLFVAYLIIKKPKNKLLIWSFTLIISGAVGNLIDRITKGAVVDFFDFRLINFPIFNVADCLIVIGAGLLILYVLREDSVGGKA